MLDYNINTIELFCQQILTKPCRNQANQSNFDKIELRINNIHDVIMIHNATRCQNVQREVNIDAKSEK